MVISDPIAHSVREIMQDRVDLPDLPRISQAEYQQWCRGFVFEGLRNQRYGQSFCNHFNITDNILFYERDYQVADAYIRKNYTI